MMTYTTTQLRLGPEFTPPWVKKIIFITIGISLFSALADPFLMSLFGFSGLQFWLSLSWYGLSQFCLWQPISFLFISSPGFYGISFFYLISLAFQMYILWIMGSAIAKRVGEIPFLWLYLISGASAGLLTLLMNNGVLLSGPAPSLMALLIVWTMLLPEMEILLFFLIPVKIKWLSVGILAALLLVNLSQLNISNLLFYFTGACVGYLWAAIAWGLSSPFSVTNRFDTMLARIGDNFRRKWKSKQKKTEESSKIIDFQSGKPKLNDDDRFVDAMLTKISKHGEKSLTWRERRRLDKISEKKKK